MDDVADRPDLLRPTIRGRPFAKGNPGRRPGSKNRSTLLADALLDNEGPELARKGLELAKSGDSLMLRFFLERIFPKDRPLQVDLFLNDDDGDPVERSGKIVEAVAGGQITPSEASALMDT